MLQDKEDTAYNLSEEKVNAGLLLPAELQQYLHADNQIWKMIYPVIAFPNKVSSVTFDKDPEISGILNGIKGQYLIFSDGKVLNIRKHNGYWLEVSLNN